MIALSTGSLYTYGLRRVFELALKAGFDGVEILIDERWDTRQASYLRHLSADYPLAICSLHAPFVPFVPGWPSDPVERLKYVITLAQELGVKTVVVHLPLRIGYVVMRGFRRSLRLPTFLAPDRKMRHWMERGLATFEAATGLNLCVENMPAYPVLGRRLNLYCWNNLQEWSRFTQLALDTTHLGTWSLDPLQIYRRVKARVSHIHLSNFNGKEHRRLEEGHLPLADFLHVLQQDSFPGAIVIELCPESLEAHDECLVLAHLKKQVAFCRQHLT